jgi:hypothetical protein
MLCFFLATHLGERIAKCYEGEDIMLVKLFTPKQEDCRLLVMLDYSLCPTELLPLAHLKLVS